MAGASRAYVSGDAWVDHLWSGLGGKSNLLCSVAHADLLSGSAVFYRSRDDCASALGPSERENSGKTFRRRAWENTAAKFLDVQRAYKESRLKKAGERGRTKVPPLH